MDVLTPVGIVTWDGMATPDEKGKFSLKIAVDPNDPQYAALKQEVDRELKEGKFKGVMPAGGQMPFLDTDVTKLGQLVAGTMSINASTKFSVPVINNENKQLSALEYNSLLYPGCKIRMVVSGWSYDNMSKGIAFNLMAVQIVDPMAPKLDVAVGMTTDQAVSAFATPAAAAAPTLVPVAAPPAAPHPNFVNNTPTPTPGPQMTEKAAGSTYEQFIAQGWTDETLRANGYMI